MKLKRIFFWCFFIPFGTMGIWLPQALWGVDSIKFCLSAAAYICSVVICSTVEKALVQYLELNKLRFLIYMFAIAVACVLCFIINWTIKQDHSIFALILSSVSIVLVFIFWWYQNKNNNAFDEPNNALGGKL